MLRLCTRVAHSRSIAEVGERNELELRPYVKDASKTAMIPAFAKIKHPLVEERTSRLTQYAETSPLNRVEMGDTSIGIITSGISYCYAKEALGENASYLKLGMVNPMPVELIKDFAAKVDKLYVIEELDPIIETHCRKIGVDVIGKDLFPICGEFSQAIVREKILGETPEVMALNEPIPPRPPAMCSGCPHRGVFYTLKKLGVYVSGDIGCYSLGVAAPLSAIDTIVCMGASISTLHGYNKALGQDAEKRSVAVIGDSTFIHTGINSLIDVAYNRSNSVVIILDNSITGMTGHQQNPTTGYTIKGDPTAAVSLEALVKSIGIERVNVVDPYDLTSVEQIIKQELEADAPSVIIARRPCALLKYVQHNPPSFIDTEKCRGCKACMKIGCPSISFSDGKAKIDHTLCLGCGVCGQLCKFDAIKNGEVR